MIKINFIAALISVIIAGFFLYSVLTPPSMFNFLPFAIHEAFFLNSSIEEGTFIKIFDIIMSVLIFWIVYLAVRKIITAIKGLG